MSVEDYRDNFRYIQGNLTEWLHDGCRAVAADNRYSLARWAGAYWRQPAAIAEGQTDGADCESGSEARISFEKPCTRKQLMDKALQQAEEAGLKTGAVRMYYPYPDMHLPLALYSDGWLPHCGELTNNYRNFGTDRLKIFDEAKAWDELITDGMFPEYSNSYLAVMTPDDVQKLPVFVKYSNDRAKQYRICTEIYEDDKGRRIVKRPMTAEAGKHIAALAINSSKLNEKYKNYYSEKGIKVSANECHMEGDTAVIEFLEYGTLEEKLIEFSRSNDIRKITEAVRTFADIVTYNPSCGVWDIDMIFKNIFVNDNLSEWIITDYEWSWQIDDVDAGDIADYIIQRAVYYFIADNPGIQVDEDALYDAAGVQKPQLLSHCYEKDNEFERKFQEHVKSGHISLNDIYAEEHGTVLDVSQIADWTLEKLARDKIDADRMSCDIRQAGELKELTIQTGGQKSVTVHPAHGCCFVYIKSTSVPCSIRTNGTKINSRLYAFTSTEPEIIFNLKKQSETLGIQMYVGSQGGGDSPSFEAAVRAYTWKRLFV